MAGIITGTSIAIITNPTLIGSNLGDIPPKITNRYRTRVAVVMILRIKWSSLTNTCGTDIPLGTSVTIITAIRVGNILGLSGGRIAEIIRTGVIVIFGRHSYSRTTGSSATKIVGGTGIPVTAGAIIGLVRIGTDTGCRITDSCLMTLVQGLTNNQMCPRTGPGLTTIRQGAAIPVVTRSIVCFIRIGTDSGRGIAGPYVMTLIRGGTNNRI